MICLIGFMRMNFWCDFNIDLLIYWLMPSEHAFAWFHALIFALQWSMLHLLFAVVILIDWLIHWFIHWLINWLSDRLIVINSSMDQSIDWFSVQTWKEKNVVMFSSILINMPCKPRYSRSFTKAVTFYIYFKTNNYLMKKKKSTDFVHRVVF